MCRLTPSHILSKFLWTADDTDETPKSHLKELEPFKLPKKPDDEICPASKLTTKKPTPSAPFVIDTLARRIDDAAENVHKLFGKMQDIIFSST
ncbi:hypothetical protein TNCV_3424941 [Trichonephila clavipes]|nr:hypothetical protein TNCV_3424941 [Trichonephila clavipes]